MRENGEGIESFYMVYNRRKIRLIEGHEKCRNLKKFTFKGTCGRCLSVWNPELHIPPPLTHCIVYTCVHCTVYCTYSLWEGGGEVGGRVEPERWGEGQQGREHHKAGLKIPTWLNVRKKSPFYKFWNTPAAKSLYRSIFRWLYFALPSIWVYLSTCTMRSSFFKIDNSRLPIIFRARELEVPIGYRHGWFGVAKYLG